MTDRLVTRAKALSDQADKRFGQDAWYRTDPHEVGVKVRIRPLSLSVRELSDLTRAGFTNISARWRMQTKHPVDVKSGDMLYTSGFLFEILDRPAAEADQLGIEWTIYTHRM